MQQPDAEVAQSVERRLPKPKVAGSKPVFRSQKVLQCAGLFSCGKSNPLSLRDIPQGGKCRNLLRRTRVAPWLVSFGHCAHSATALKRLAIPVMCFFLRPSAPSGQAAAAAGGKPEIRIRVAPVLEGPMEGVGLECGRIFPCIDAQPLLQALVEVVLSECECRVWVRQLISWTQNGWKGCGVQTRNSQSWRGCAAGIVGHIGMWCEEIWPCSARQGALAAFIEEVLLRCECSASGRR